MILFFSFLLFIFRIFFGKSSLGCGLLNLNIYEWCIFKYSEQDTILSAVKASIFCKNLPMHVF